MKHIKKRLFTNSHISPIFIAAPLTVAVIPIVSLIAAIIANMSSDPTKNLSLYTLAALIVAGAISGVVNTRIKGDGGLLFATLIAVGVSLIMLIISLIVNGKIPASALMNYATYIGATLAAAYLGRKRERRIKR